MSENNYKLIQFFSENYLEMLGSDSTTEFLHFCSGNPKLEKKGIMVQNFS